MITLYSNGCPRCSILKKKLDDKGVNYAIISDEEEMIAKGFKTVPMLEVNGELMDFGTAVRWTNDI